MRSTKMQEYKTGDGASSSAKIEMSFSSSLASSTPAVLVPHFPLHALSIPVFSAFPGVATGRDSDLVSDDKEKWTTNERSLKETAH